MHCSRIKMVAALGIVLHVSANLRAECIAVRTRIYGAVCGVASDSLTGNPASNETLWLVNRGTDETISVRADSEGRFRFPPVPPGVYRIGWMAGVSDDSIEIRSSASTTCTRQLEVVLRYYECGAFIHTRSFARDFVEKLFHRFSASHVASPAWDSRHRGTPR